jgi:hypothetical protein
MSNFSIYIELSDSTPKTSVQFFNYYRIPDSAPKLSFEKAPYICSNLILLGHQLIRSDFALRVELCVSVEKNCTLGFQGGVSEAEKFGVYKCVKDTKSILLLFQRDKIVYV